MKAEEYLGLDVGKKRIGVARGSSVARLAEPLMTLPTKGALKELDTLIQKHHAAGLVVGLPRSLKGDETAQTGWVRDFTDTLKQKFALPIVFQDEALTSHQALAGGASKADVDAIAAAMILQDFLDGLEVASV